MIDFLRNPSKRKKQKKRFFSKNMPFLSNTLKIKDCFLGKRRLELGLTAFAHKLMITMHCTSYSTASSYKIPALFEFLQTKGPAQLFRDVIHLEVKENNVPKGDVFYFPYGVVVCWGLSDMEETLFLSYTKAFEKHPIHKTERDDFSYVYCDSMKIEED